MTYVVYDGTILIADKMVQQTVGSYLFGRKPRREDGTVNQHKAGTPVTIKYSDCLKIIKPAAGTYEGKKIVRLAAAGLVTNLGEVIEYLERGGELNDYILSEVCIQPKTARRFFVEGNQLLVITEDGKGAMIQPNKSGIGHYDQMPIHIGCGAAWVGDLLTLSRDDTKITSLEAHTYASNMDTGVSMSFDYYVPKTDVEVLNQTLTHKQRSKILHKLQSQIDITPIPVEVSYVN